MGEGTESQRRNTEGLERSHLGPGFPASQSTEPVPGRLLCPGEYSELGDLPDDQVPTEPKCANQLSVLSPQPRGLLDLLGDARSVVAHALLTALLSSLTPSEDLFSSGLPI